MKILGDGIVLVSKICYNKAAADAAKVLTQTQAARSLTDMSLFYIHRTNGMPGGELLKLYLPLAHNEKGGMSSDFVGNLHDAHVFRGIARTFGSSGRNCL